MGKSGGGGGGGGIRLGTLGTIVFLGFTHIVEEFEQGPRQRIELLYFVIFVK